MKQIADSRLLSIILLLAISVTVCSAQDDGRIKFDKKVHDFGDVLISDGPVNCTFTFTNNGKSPVVVHNVVSSCGCTTPTWTKEPVRPGDKGVISAVFTNDQGPFPFDKSLTVYISSSDRPIILRLKGVAHEKQKSIDELYTVRIGKLGLRKVTYSIGFIDQGTTKSDIAAVANTGKSPLLVETYDVTPGLLVNITPNPIPAHSVAKMTFTVNTELMKKKDWGKQVYTAQFELDGKKYEGVVTVNGTIKDNFNSMTEEQKKSAASPVVEKSYFDFGEVKAGKVLENSYTIRNKGKSELIIYKVEGDRKGFTPVSQCPIRIKPGGSGVVKIKFDTSKFSGEVLEILTAVTNSPSKPNFNLFITGTVR